MNFTDLIIPFLVGIIILVGLIKKVDIFGEFLQGAKENLLSALDILPPLIILMTAIGMFRASGGLNFISSAIKPIADLVGFPQECIPLALIRSISGSGALAVYENLLTEYSPDSFAGRVASVLMGSTETTFYTIAIYFSVIQIKKTRHTVVSSVLADITGFLASAITVAIIFYSYKYI